MKLLACAIVASMLAFAATGYVFAQQAQNQTFVTRADSLKGWAVRNDQGEMLGKVSMVALDMQRGIISYLAVDPGTGNKLIPVPFTAFHSVGDRELYVNMNKDRFLAAPSYAKGSNPEWGNSYWAQQVASYWGNSPSGIMVGQASPSSTSSQAGQASMASSSMSAGPAQSSPMSARDVTVGPADAHPMHVR